MAETQNELILINLQGPDKPGQTARITGVLENHKVDILDIGQAVIHNDLSLSMLISISD